MSRLRYHVVAGRISRRIPGPAHSSQLICHGSAAPHPSSAPAFAVPPDVSSRHRLCDGRHSHDFAVLVSRRRRNVATSDATARSSPVFQRSRYYALAPHLVILHFRRSVDSRHARYE